MKSIKLTLFSLAIACVFLCCKKGEEDDTLDCEENNTTKVTFTNTGTVPLRVEVATTLTPQYTTVNPIFSLDLAPGASVTREFTADKYFNVWYRNCATSCSRVTYNYKTYVQCNEYEEKQGF